MTDPTPGRSATHHAAAGRGTNGRHVIWIRTTAAMALAALVGFTVMTIILLINPGHVASNHTLTARLGFGTVLGGFLWFFWHGLMASRIILDNEGLILPGWFTERGLAWADITHIDTARGIVLTTASGRKITLANLSSSVIGQFTGYRQATDTAQQIDEYKKRNHPDSQRNGRLRIRPRLLAAAVILTFTTTMAITTQALFH